MTSSGTSAFSLANSEGVIAAFERIQVDPTEIKQRHILTARREMNLLFSEFSNKQVNLWKVVLRSFPLVSGTATYTLANDVVMVLDSYFSTNQGTVTQTDLIMNPISRDEYAGYPQKQTTGAQTIMYWFNRQITPTITTYPVFSSATASYINYYACVQIQDANMAGGETPDVPYLWYDAMVAGMAYRLARVFKPELEDKRKIDAKEAWDIAAAQNTENVNLTIVPDVGAYYR